MAQMDGQLPKIVLGMRHLSMGLVEIWYAPLTKHRQLISGYFRDHHNEESGILMDLSPMAQPGRRVWSSALVSPVHPTSMISIDLPVVITSQSRAERHVLPTSVCLHFCYRTSCFLSTHFICEVKLQCRSASGVLRLVTADNPRMNSDFKMELMEGDVISLRCSLFLIVSEVKRRFLSSHSSGIVNAINGSQTHCYT